MGTHDAHVFCIPYEFSHLKELWYEWFFQVFLYAVLIKMNLFLGLIRTPYWDTLRNSDRHGDTYMLTLKHIWARVRGRRSGNFNAAPVIHLSKPLSRIEPPTQ